MQFNMRGILLDIEGTTSSISFVYDKMFPFVRENLETYLNEHWQDDSLQACFPLLSQDVGRPLTEKHTAIVEQKELVAAAVIELMDGDVKATGLKQLQGLIWKNGFHSGQLVSHLFDDVSPAIKRWHADGLDIRIYSSGSIAAQKLFFGHSVAGDLLPLLSGHYDTTTGPKKEADSYVKIAKDFAMNSSEILFVSDVVDELKAAQKTGMQTLLSLRPGNKSQGEHEFESIQSFAEIELTVNTSA